MIPSLVQQCARLLRTPNRVRIVENVPKVLKVRGDRRGHMFSGNSMGAQRVCRSEGLSFSVCPILRRMLNVPGPARPGRLLAGSVPYFSSGDCAPYPRPPQNLRALMPLSHDQQLAVSKYLKTKGNPPKCPVCEASNMRVQSDLLTLPTQSTDEDARYAVAVECQYCGHLLHFSPSVMGLTLE